MGRGALPYTSVLTPSTPTFASKSFNVEYWVLDQFSNKSTPLKKKKLARVGLALNWGVALEAIRRVEGAEREQQSPTVSVLSPGLGGPLFPCIPRSGNRLAAGLPSCRVAAAPFSFPTTTQGSSTSRLPRSDVG